MKNNSTSIASLKEADKVIVTTIIDNYTDRLLSSSEIKTRLVTRAPHRWADGKLSGIPLAEHGLSLLIKIFQNGQEHGILFDGGATRTGIRHNLGALRIDLRNVEMIVLSHGHKDHYGGLIELVKHLNTGGVPLVSHPDAFQVRYRKRTDGKVEKQGQLREELFEKLSVNVIKSRGPYLIASDLALMTGEIERETDFEETGADRLLKINNKLEHDFIHDDQSMIINLRGKGLIIISGCAHSGIINTINHAMKLTGVDKIYAVMGGFHLTGSGFENKTEKTIEYLKKFNPAVLIPTHCTSWKSMQMIYNALPHSFVLNNVGTTINFD